MTVGLADTDKIFYFGRHRRRQCRSSMSAPRPAATASTARPWPRPSSTRKIEEKRPTVQVGDPFTEKLLIEACLELMATDAIVAIQDMGAAGLTSLPSRWRQGRLGIELDLDKVPQREDRHDAYEMMLSESQERMLMVLKPGKEAEAEAIFEKWELDFAVIGEVTDTGRMVLDTRARRCATSRSARWRRTHRSMTARMSRQAGPSARRSAIFPPARTWARTC
jgi:phosphoribosylformylglycinamidine (FGAM) synthase-like enzyme